jgi:hypothetical protein
MQAGHNAMGDIVIERLKKAMQRSTGPINLPQSRPAGRTCSCSVPLRT